MDFITIDFETATAERDSACEIGLAFVENDQLIETKSWLIKPPSYPYFDGFNVSIHGIRPEDVADSPTFEQLWPELEPLLSGKFLIAHNAGFDMSVLRHTLQHYHIPLPRFDYSCSYLFSKRVWEDLPSYGLSSLCRMNNIKFSHHRAGADAEATAKLCLLAFNRMGAHSPLDFPKKMRTLVNGFPDSSLRKDPSLHQPDHIFYQKRIVLAGALNSMTKRVAQQIILDIGGRTTDSLSKKTNYLVIPQSKFKGFGGIGITKNERKAQELIAEGAQLEVISEWDFLENI